MKILHILFTLCVVAFLVNHSEASTQPENPDTIKNEVFELSIKNGELVGSSNVIRVTQGTKLTLVLESDKILNLHLHGYDILKEVFPESPTFMVIDAFATGRFPIKVHIHDTDPQGNIDNESTLTYLEVYPD